MRVAGSVFGVFGGVMALYLGTVQLFADKIPYIGVLTDASFVSGLGFLAVPLAILGIAGGVLAYSQPTWAGGAMVLSAATGMAFATAVFLVPSVLLMTGGLLAIAGVQEWDYD